MDRYEYGRLVWHTAYKGAIIKGDPVLAFIFITETTEQLIKQLELLPALNHLGRDGWVEYRCDPTGSPMPESHRVLFKERHGWVPRELQPHPPKWFKRVIDPSRSVY